MSSPIRAAVIGHPIGHTMSPFLHERLFVLSELEAEYRVLDVPDLAAAMPELRQLDCFNVTIPHKQAILPLLDSVDREARVCGSVNTVYRREDRLLGSTTDGAGCVKALKAAEVFLGGEVFLLGTGGAARAIAFALADEMDDGQLVIVAREQSLDKAEALVDEVTAFVGGGRRSGLTVQYGDYGEVEKAFAQGETANLLINATSVGMWPNTAQSPVSEQVVRGVRAVFDAVYNPRETQLLRMARENGIKTVGGMAMLVYQAAAAHELWYDGSFSRQDLLTLIDDANAEMARRFGEGQA